MILMVLVVALITTMLMLVVTMMLMLNAGCDSVDDVCNDEGIDEDEVEG